MNIRDEIDRINRVLYNIMPCHITDDKYASKQEIDRERRNETEEAMNDAKRNELIADYRRWPEEWQEQLFKEEILDLLYDISHAETYEEVKLLLEKAMMNVVDRVVEHE